MSKVLARSIAPLSWATSHGEIVAIESRLGRLRIEVTELGGSRRAEIVFDTTEGFRVLDERDLGEFWPTCSSANGWVFEISKGGWLSQELERSESLVAHMNRNLREFLVAGIDDCVSVLSVVDPEIRDVAPQNEA